MITLSGVDQFLAALPALFGFYPDRSLIFAPIRPAPAGRPGSQVLTTARVDLGNALNDPENVIAALVAASPDTPLQEVFIVLVGTAEGSGTPPSPDTIAPLRIALDRLGVTNVEIIHIAAFAAGARWFSYDHPGRHGTLPDPETSPATTEMILQGDVIYRSRDELTKLFTPAPDTDRARLAPLIDAVAATVTDEEARHDLPALRARLARLDQAVTNAAHGTLPSSDDDIADLIGAFACVWMRDALVAPTGQTGRAAETLWLALWKYAPAPMSDRLAALLMTHACYRGHGALASAAANAAGRDERLVALLVCALQQGVKHARLRSMLETAVSNTRDALGQHR